MNGLPCLIGLIVCTVGIFVVLNVQVKAADAADRKRREASDAYQLVLDRLKKDPTNADLKQHVLRVGRDYANMTRDQKGVTVFDEVALSNDISAATAGATVAKAAPASSVEEQLQALEGLRSKGLVNADEYTERRKQLLAEI